VSCETKLTSGNEADRNQSAMREVEIKTATERGGPCHRKRTFVSLARTHATKLKPFESISVL
jgi:hypothetical protein